MSKFVKLESGAYINVDNIITIHDGNAYTTGFDNDWQAHAERVTKKDVDNIMKTTSSSESSKPVLSREILETVLTLIDAERYNLGGQLGAVENSGAPHEVIESERCQILDEDAPLQNAEDELRYLYEQQGGHWESPSIKRASKAYGFDD